MLKMRAFFAVVVLFCASGAFAHAEPIDLSATASLNFLDGAHDESNTRDRVAFSPLPLVQIDARYRHIALHVEGLPPVTFGYANGTANSEPLPYSNGIESTRLSLLTGTLRYYAGETYAGAGITVYDQNTNRGTYQNPVFIESEDDSSRVVGARFEIGNVHRLDRSTTLETNVSFNPVMHGVEDAAITTVSVIPPPAPLPSSFSCEQSIVRGYIACISPGLGLRGLPERASQIDTSALVVRHFRRGALIGGIRYLNYAANYAIGGNVANKSLADRNVGFMPLIAYRWVASR